MASDRRAKEDEVILIIRFRNLARYGVDVCDESWVRGLSDQELTEIIERDKQLIDMTL